ncbi:MAG: alpha/beta hydrolase [Acidobacteriota bacterium]|nr:alpha/beta hydrolase [Acidobacteriota bacterium]
MRDVGAGPPIVLIPGIQGRWEWMGPAIGEVSKRCRVLTFSYDRTPGAQRRQNEGTERNLDRLVDQVVEVMDAAGVAQATICGVSFGGFIATRFAARFPERTRALILVSSPTPRWAPNVTLLKYMERPLLSMPLVLPAWFLRMWPEIFAAKPSLAARARFATRYFTRALISPLSVTKMSEWAKLKLATDIVADCAHVKAPALLITGEPGLDRVIDLRQSSDWTTLIPGIRHVTIERTGHIGLVSKPDLFADIVCGFMKEQS